MESDASLISTMNLGGLTHLTGAAGAGKTLFAIALACEVSRRDCVEWINADAKRGFVPLLKRNLEQSGGQIKNIAVTITDSPLELITTVESLSEKQSSPSLLVIDPITRVLDMARDDPVLWGRDLIEIVLPTLAGIVSQGHLDIIIISENRMSEFSDNHAVHHKSISKWVDHDICLIRSLSSSDFRIVRRTREVTTELAIMKIDECGLVRVVPRLPFSMVSGSENQSVR